MVFPRALGQRILHNRRRSSGLYASGAASCPWRAALVHRRPCAARRKPI